MNKLISKFKSSESIKNVSKITGGTMLGQVISFVVVPIYTRLYGASIMGMWALFTSIASILVTFSDLGLKNAIMIEEKESDTIDLYCVITTITLLSSAIVSVGVFFFYQYVKNDSGLPAWLIGVFVFVLAVTTQQTQTCYTWLNKKAEYSVLMKNPIVNNVSAAIVIIALGLCGFTRYGFYIGTMFGQVATLVHMKVRLPNKFVTFDSKLYKKVMNRQREFVKYQLPASVVAQVKEQIPVFMIKGLFGADILGYYSISMKYLKLPINLLAQSIGRVYYQTISKMRVDGKEYSEIGEYSYRNINRAMKLAYVPMIVIIAVGDVACRIMFGQDYDIAGNIMRIVAFNSFFLFIATATNGLAIVIDKQSYILICALAQLVGYILGIGAGYYLFDSIFVSCLIMTVIYCLLQIAYFARMFFDMKVDWRKYVVRVMASIGLILFISEAIRIVLMTIGIVETL